jgi:hypothetical protein
MRLGSIGRLRNARRGGVLIAFQHRRCKGGMKERDAIPEYEMGKEQGTGNREGDPWEIWRLRSLCRRGGIKGGLFFGRAVLHLEGAGPRAVVRHKLASE